jgi:SAM-dependent methyltransferase
VAEIAPYDAVLAHVQELCDRRVSDRDPARVLDAGSGLRSYVQFADDVHITGIDVSSELLEANPRLDARIHGDLHDVDIPERAYDCVVCWDVLEHLAEPERVVAKLARAVAGEGLLVVGAPNRRSVKGLVTRFTPYGFHLWVYRRFFDSDASEEPGGGPYRTFLRPGCDARAVRKAAEAQGLRTIYTAWVESPMQAGLRERLRITGARWRLVRGAVRALSFASVDAEASDYVCVFEQC